MAPEAPGRVFADAREQSEIAMPVCPCQVLEQTNGYDYKARICGRSDRCTRAKLVFECGLRERLSDVSTEVCRKMRWAGSIRPNILSRINGQEPDRMKIMHA